MMSMSTYPLLIAGFVSIPDAFVVSLCIVLILYWVLSAGRNRSETSSNQPTPEPPTGTLTPDIEQVVRARFQPGQAKTDTDAIRPAPQEVAEPHDHP